MENKAKALCDKAYEFLEDVLNNPVDRLNGKDAKQNEFNKTRYAMSLETLKTLEPISINYQMIDLAQQNKKEVK